MSDNYWGNRTKSRVGTFEKIRNNGTLLRILAAVWPMRFANEYQLSKWLTQLQPEVTIDVACGVGKIQIPTKSAYTIGVDITGYPSQVARAKGYQELHTYDAPHYEYTTQRKASLITIINLNAHVSPEAYLAILNQTLQNAADEVHILMINEYNGTNAIYNLMRRNPQRFQKMVKLQQHDYFGTQNDFIEHVQKSILDIQLVKTEPLSIFPPLLHSFAYFFGSTTKNYFEVGLHPVLNSVFLLIEIPFGLIDTIFRKIAAKDATQQSFLCAHLFKVNRRKPEALQ